LINFQVQNIVIFDFLRIYQSTKDSRFLVQKIQLLYKF